MKIRPLSLTFSDPATGALPALDLARIVRPVRRRMAAQLLLAWILRGAGAVLISAALFVVAGHLVAWPAADPLGGPRGWAILVSLLIAAAVLVVVASAWPTVDQAIRAADRAMGLKDRLTTAREFAGRDSELIVLQRQELRRHLERVDLRQAVRPKLPRRDAALIALGALLVLGATLLPNPQATAQAQQRQQRRIATYAAARTAALVHLPHTTATAKGDGHQPAPAGRDMRAVQSVLRRLQTQLAGAKSPVQAIKALTAAQQKLQGLNAQSTQAQQSLAAAARALASGQTSSLAKALQKGDAAATRKALESLARSLPKLSAADRQAVAKALAGAAAGQQGTLAQALQKAAQAAGGDPAAAGQSLASLAQQLQAAQASATAASSSSKALQDLAKIKQDVANGVGGPQPQAGPQAQPLPSTGGPQDQSAPEQAQPGQPSGSKGNGKAGKGSGGKASGGKGSGGQPGKGSGSTGSAQGQQGTGQSKGQGQAGGNGGKGGGTKGSAASGGQAGNRGRGAAAGSSGGAANGAAGSGANGLGSGQGSPGHGGSGGSAGTGAAGSGHFERVYLPGDRHGGPSTQIQGELGRSIQVQSGAFRQLVSQYAQAADSTLGRAALPPDRQAAVKRYFQSLEQN